MSPRKKILVQRSWALPKPKTLNPTLRRTVPVLGTAPALCSGRHPTGGIRDWWVYGLLISSGLHIFRSLRRWGIFFFALGSEGFRAEGFEVQE